MTELPGRNNLRAAGGVVAVQTMNIFAPDPTKHLAAIYLTHLTLAAVENEAEPNGPWKR